MSTRRKPTGNHLVFKGLQRGRQANRPYPRDGETALTCRVAALDRAENPLLEQLLVSLCRFSRQISLIYENVT